MSNLWQDIRFSMRMMLKNFRFAFAVIFILAIGISANSTVFSIVQAVLLRPLPYADSERLAMLWKTNVKMGLENAPVTYPNYVDFKERAQSFDSMATFRAEDFSLTNAGDPTRLMGVSVSDGFFSLLGVPALRGRTFTPEEYKAGLPSAILSYDLWQRRFGSDQSVIGKAIRLNEKSFNVVGVMPKGFRFPGEIFEKCDLWIPLALAQDEVSNRNAHTFFIIARLKPQTPLTRAQSELESVARQLDPQGKEADAGWGTKITPLREQFVGDVKKPLVILFGAVSFVLLVACINIANLLLSHSAARQKEIAIRMAIGANRRRLVQQLLTESLLLSIFGGALGLLLAVLGITLLKTIIPVSYIYVEDVGIDGKVLVFTALIAVLTSVLFGLVPALQATRVDINSWLKEGSGKSSSGPRRRYLSNLLIISEISLSLVLIIGAALMIKSFILLQQVDPGFNPNNVLAISLALPETKYPEAQQKRAFFQQVVQQLRTMPGVKSVGGVNNLPLSESDKIRAFLVEGNEGAAASEVPTASYSMALGDYFSTLHIPLIKGRIFTEQDTERTPLVAVINQALARRFFPNQDPVGKRLILKNNDPKIIREVVGVVGDVKAYGLDAETNPTLFVPFTQDPFPAMSIVMRSDINPSALISVARNAVRSADPSQPIDNITTMSEMVSKSTAKQRLNMIMLSIFAGTALILAAVGIYSVLSHSVFERTREIGIRIALGAAPARIMKMIALHSLRLILIGLAIGLIVAFLLARIISSLLYEVKALDPLIFFSVPLFLAVVALIASYLPARKASRVDPMIALRNE